MITIDKKEIKACCGKSQIIWKLNVPIKQENIDLLQQAGFFPVKSYLNIGMLYVEDKGLIASGVFGMNEIRINCKNKLCQESIILFEKTVLSFQ